MHVKDLQSYKALRLDQKDYFFPSASELPVNALLAVQAFLPSLEDIPMSYIFIMLAFEVHVAHLKCAVISCTPFMTTKLTNESRRVF